MKANPSKALILKPANFDAQVKKYLEIHWCPKFLFTDDDLYKVSDTKLSYRVINSWTQAGLLLTDNSNGDKWKRFCFAELAWLQVIKQLRSIGFSLEKLRRVRSSLFKIEKEGVDVEYFVYYLIRALEEEVFVVVTPDGNADIGTEEEYFRSQVKRNYQVTNVLINLKLICAELPELQKYETDKETFYSLLTGREVEIRERLAKDPDLKEVIQSIKDGRVNRVSYKKQKSNLNEREVFGLITKSGDRSTTVVKKENGKFVLVEQVEKT
jgi:DNA-binding transcriptional MerR regulator